VWWSCRAPRSTAVGGDAAIPAGAQVIDLGDATLLPGFIDAHVHLSSESSRHWYHGLVRFIMRFPAEQALYGAHYAKVTLEAGITTVRDVGSFDYISLGIAQCHQCGNDSGTAHAGGQLCHRRDRRPCRSGPGAAAAHRRGGADPGRVQRPRRVPHAVRYQIKYGADVIKFMPSGGVLSLSDPVDNAQLTQEEMNAIVSEAHNWGRKVAAHCHGDRAAKMAIAAGVDSIEHGSFLQDDTLLEMKKKHVYLVATLFAGAWVGQHLDTFPPAIAVKARAPRRRLSRCSSMRSRSACRSPWAPTRGSSRMA
jgi:imidazolonepropionase-like amidohydrolase